jgi:tetratricopeptide (TPR) repeat protein
LIDEGTDDAIGTALRLAAGLQRLWDTRSRWNEGASWLREALARPGGAPAVRAKAHKALAVMNRCLGNLDVAEAELEQAVALNEVAGDVLSTASCRNNQGVIALDRAAYARTSSLCRQALEVCEAYGDEQLQAIVLNNLGIATLELGEPREALRLLRHSRALMQAHGNVGSLSWPEDNLGWVLTTAGHPRWAVPLHHTTIRRRLELGDESGFLWSLEALAAAWTATGETVRAGRALGFVAADRQRLGALPVPFLEALTARRADALQARIGADRFRELWDEGAALDPGSVRSWFVP